MARKQNLAGPIGNGWVEEVKNGGGTRYVARWKSYAVAPDGSRRRINGGQHELGAKVHHGPGLNSLKAAEKKWAEIAASIMGRPTAALPNILKAEKTFRWFAEEDPDGFRKRREQRWSGSTPEWYDYIMRKILAVFGDVKLKDLKEQDLQSFLNKLADDDYSECVVKNSRLYLRAVLAEAVECAIIPLNPAARLIKPRNTRKPQRQWLAIEKFQEIIAQTPAMRDRLMMKILYICGLRRGELFGLQWHDFDGVGTLLIERQILEDLTVGPAKTDGSIAPVTVPSDLAQELIEWGKWCPNRDADGWIFSSPRKAHINPSFWRKSVLVPVGNAVGITKLNYHMFRRGLATEANQHGINDKTIQGQLRHSSVNTTRDIYTQNIPAAQRTAFESFARVVEGPKQ